MRAGALLALSALSAALSVSGSPRAARAEPPAATPAATPAVTSAPRLAFEEEALEAYEPIETPAPNAAASDSSDERAAPLGGSFELNDADELTPSLSPSFTPEEGGQEGALPQGDLWGDEPLERAEGRGDELEAELAAYMQDLRDAPEHSLAPPYAPPPSAAHVHALGDEPLDGLLPWGEEGELPEEEGSSPRARLELVEVLSDEQSIAEALVAITGERPAGGGGREEDDDSLDDVPYAIQSEGERDTFVDHPATPPRPMNAYPAHHHRHDIPTQTRHPEGFGGVAPTQERPSDRELSAGWSRVAEQPPSSSLLARWIVIVLTALALVGIIYWKLALSAP